MYNNYGNYPFNGVMSSYHLVTVANTPQVITLAELKTHLNLFDETEYDTYLTTLLETGQRLAENYVGEHFDPTVVTAYYNTQGQRFFIPNRYIEAVENLRYYDTDNAIQTVDRSNYFLDATSRVPAVVLSRNFGFPEVSNEFQNPCLLYTSPSPRDS